VCFYGKCECEQPRRLVADYLHSSFRGATREQFFPATNANGVTCRHRNCNHIMSKITVRPKESRRSSTD
jgi:hypothetical protein